MNVLRDAMRCSLQRLVHASDAVTAELAADALKLEAQVHAEPCPRERAVLAYRFIAIVDALVELRAFERTRLDQSVGRGCANRS